MAVRPVYTATLEGSQLVHTRQVVFQWFPGLAVSQKQKSIDALHAAAAQQPGVGKLLEISSKSRTRLGIALSAFNLTLAGSQGRDLCVECAFQGSKVFERGGPFVDLFDKSAREAKTDARLQSAGRLTGFEYLGVRWGLDPKTAFYDWLYLNAVQGQPALHEQLLEYDSFTDIEFNPARSINCQAYAAALFVSLARRALLQHALVNKDAFLAAVGG